MDALQPGRAHDAAAVFRENGRYIIVLAGGDFLE
jgi:hypothetical protein